MTNDDKCVVEIGFSHVKYVGVSDPKFCKSQVDNVDFSSLLKERNASKKVLKIKFKEAKHTQ